MAYRCDRCAACFFFRVGKSGGGDDGYVSCLRDRLTPDPETRAWDDMGRARTHQHWHGCADPQVWIRRDAAEPGKCEPRTETVDDVACKIEVVRYRDPATGRLSPTQGAPDWTPITVLRSRSLVPWWVTDAREMRVSDPTKNSISHLARVFRVGRRHMVRVLQKHAWRTA